MRAADLVEHLHPGDDPSRAHTLAAVMQIRELMRYLAIMADQQTAAQAYPAPNVVSDVALILRDGMADVAQLFGLLAARTDQFADGPRLYAAGGDDRHPGSAAYYVEQAGIKLLAAGALADRLTAELDAAGEAGAAFNVRSGA